VALYSTTGVLICAIQMAIIPLFPLTNQPAEVIAAGTPYYKYLAWSIIPMMLFFAFKQFLEGVGNTRVEMVVTIVCNLANVGLNWVFIYGNLGAPAMGAAGAGLATLISRAMMPLAMIGYFAWNRTYKRYLLFYTPANWSGERVRTLLSVGFPISLQMTLEGGAFAITGIMMGWLGTNALAANQITLMVCNMAFLMVLSIGLATTIRVSHEYGLRDFAAIRRVAGSSRRIALVWNVSIAVVFIVFRNYLPRIFTTDEAVVEIAGRLLVFVAAFQIFDGIQLTSLCSLRGMQDVKATSLIAFVSYMVINLPVGYLFAFVVGMGPEGLWMGYIFGLGTAALLFTRRFRRIVSRYDTLGSTAA
jgi:MATE family multidrug resistance protein